MECGIPFCHDMKGLKGCPVNNQIPDWNDLVYRGEWEQASKDLHSTNNFPELDGRYSVFGKIVKGIEILDEIKKEDLIYEIVISD